MRRLTALLALLVVVAAGCGGHDGPSLSDRANGACGTDTIIKFDHSEAGFAHRESITVTCRRPNGSIYIEVVKA